MGSGCFTALYKKTLGCWDKSNKSRQSPPVMKSSFLAFVALAVSGFAEAATYSIVDSVSGQAFLNAFSWQAIADPTNGRVYVIPSVHWHVCLIV